MELNDKIFIGITATVEGFMKYFLIDINLYLDRHMRWKLSIIRLK